jgi:hypothetical protein
MSFPLGVVEVSEEAHGRSIRCDVGVHCERCCSSSPAVCLVCSVSGVLYVLWCSGVALPLFRVSPGFPTNQAVWVS